MRENLSQFIHNSIRKNWKSKAMSDYKGKTYSYGDVGSHIAMLHSRFEIYGLVPGDKVALLGKNSATWGMAYLATITYGCVVVPILPDFKPGDIQHIVNHSESRLMFASEALFDNLDTDKMSKLMGALSLGDFSILHETSGQPLSSVEETVHTNYLKKHPLGVLPDQLALPVVPNDALAVISYTSGTTGFTKGVMLSHNSLTANVVYANNNMPLSPGDNIVSFLPLAHAYGCAFEFLWPFTLGCHVTFLTKTPSPQIILEAFKAIRPKLILSVPLIMEKIYKKQLLPVISKPHMKFLLKTPGLKNVLHKKIREKLSSAFGGNFQEVVIGGAPLNGEVETLLRTIGFPFSIGYGMTECAPLISYANWNKARLGAAGRVVDTLEIKVDSPDPLNIPGEVLVRGENVMMGYFKNPEATKAALDEEGWLHTGDLGVLDKDQFVYLKGRSKNMILGPSGQNINPEEIEAILNNKAFVQECLVVERKGALEALVYPDYELIDKTSVEEEALKQTLQQHRESINKILPAYMNIARIKIVPEEFEKTPKKSIKRFMYTQNED